MAKSNTSRSSSSSYNGTVDDALDTRRRMLEGEQENPPPNTSFYKLLSALIVVVIVIVAGLVFFTKLDYIFPKTVSNTPSPSVSNEPVYQTSDIWECHVLAKHADLSAKGVLIEYADTVKKEFDADNINPLNKVAYHMENYNTLVSSYARHCSPSPSVAAMSSLLTNLDLEHDNLYKMWLSCQMTGYHQDCKSVKERNLLVSHIQEMALSPPKIESHDSDI
jgi:hypothetical protein